MTHHIPSQSQRTQPYWSQDFHLPEAGTYITPGEACTLAASIAYQGCGYVSTNPLVGCVLVDEQHRFLSSGAHMTFGGPHAEANAVSQVKAGATKGGTAYVTLEPCAHTGKTGPCAELLKNLDLKAVYYGHQDPNPLVAGKGLKILEESGVAVHQSMPLKNLSQHALRPFMHTIRTKKTFLAMKLATTLDGSYTGGDRQRIEITRTEARSFGHWLRFFYDAIIVGANTLALDNPSLNIRNWSPPWTRPDGKVKTAPRPIIIDPKARLLYKKWRIISSTKPLWVVDTTLKLEHPEDKEVIRIPTCNGELDWQNLLSKLYNLGIQSALLEGGDKVWSSACSAKAVTFAHWCMYPGSKPRLSNTEKVFSSVNTNFHIESPELAKLGSDLVIEGELIYSEGKTEKI